jgi:hypothetical protein
MILNSLEFSNRLAVSISNAGKSLLLSSAFIKVKALEELTENIDSYLDVAVVARWKKQDILVGASDLEVYEYCRERGWRFGVDQNFHGKLYIIDESEIYLGSANLTASGLGFGLHSNYEFGTHFPAGDTDIVKVSSFLDEEVIWLNDQLYDAMSADVEVSKIIAESYSNASWSDEVTELISTPVHYLWVNDLPFLAPNKLLRLDLSCDSARHDFEMLNLDIDRLSRRDFIFQFKRTRVYSWLLAQFSDGLELRFGALTKALHDSLLDDPAPYRKNVKEFLAILFEWIEFLSDDFEVTQHNRTKSVKFKR